jgi:hypothetical protein
VISRSSASSRRPAFLIPFGLVTLGFFVACGDSSEDAGLDQPLAGAGGAAVGKGGSAGKGGATGKGGSAAKGGSSSKGGTSGKGGSSSAGAGGDEGTAGAGGDEAGTGGSGDAGEGGNPGAGTGGSSTAGCGDLLACCISLDDAADRSACQSTAAALADSPNGAAQCEKALGAYQAKGLCGGGTGGTTAGTGGSAAGTGGSAAGTGGSAAGTGGSAAGTGGSAAGTGGSAAGTGGSAGSGGSVSDLDKACARWAEALCEKGNSCSAMIKGIYKSVEECVERSAKFDCKLRFAAKSMTPWSAAEIDACAAGLTSATCEGLLTNEPASCAPHNGPRTNGQNCISSSQCASGFCSTALNPLFPDYEVCGVCETKVPQSTTTVCFGDSGCPANTYCQTFTGCFPAAALGASCASIPCQSGLYCDSGTNTCKAQKKKGDACTVDKECSRRFALSCVSNQCAALVTPVGGACPTQGYCAENGSCGGSPSVCEAPLPDGASCGAGGSFGGDTSSCAYPGSCAGNKCLTSFDCSP